DEEAIARLTQRQREIELRQEALADEVRQQDPRYAAVRQPTFVDASALAGRLEERTALLEYLVGEKESWLFVVTRQGLASYPLQLSREDVANRVTKLLATIRRPKLTRRSFCQESADLYRQIFAPAASRLAGKPDLVIVPDGALHRLPFEVLLTEATCHEKD